MMQLRWTVSTGAVTLSLPGRMSLEEVEEVREVLALQMRRLERSARKERSAADLEYASWFPVSSNGAQGESND